MLKVATKWPFFGKGLSVLTVAALLLGIFFFYIWHLGTLTPGFSQEELQATQASSSIGKIVDNPVFAPHKLLQLGFQSAGQDGAFWMRLGSVLFALAFFVFFYFLLRLWFGKFVSILGTLLLCGTPALVLVARSATPDILYLTPIAIITCFVWLSRTQRRNLAWYGLVAFTALSLYVPGMAIFVLLSVGILYKTLTKAAGLIKVSTMVISLLAAVIMVLPLIVAALDDPGVLKELFFIPSHWESPVEILKSIAWSGLALVIKTREHFPFIIDRLPLLSAIQVILIFFGLYALWGRARKEVYLILSVVGLAVLSAGIKDSPGILVATLPVLGILAAAGLRYLYKEWRDVFPINPLPRALAIMLMGSVIVLHLLYGGRYALIAWPNTEATRNTYNVLK